MSDADSLTTTRRGDCPHVQPEPHPTPPGHPHHRRDRRTGLRTSWHVRAALHHLRHPPADAATPTPPRNPTAPTPAGPARLPARPSPDASAPSSMPATSPGSRPTDADADASYSLNLISLEIIETELRPPAGTNWPNPRPRRKHQPPSPHLIRGPDPRAWALGPRHRPSRRGRRRRRGSRPQGSGKVARPSSGHARGHPGHPSFLGGSDVPYRQAEA